MTLTISEEKHEGKVILRAKGRVSAASAPLLERKIEELLHRDHLELLIDFTGVDYLSSAGLRVLLSTSKKLKAKKGKLILFSLAEEVMEIIRMAGFERVIDIAPNEKEALKGFNKT